MSPPSGAAPPDGPDQCGNRIGDFRDVWSDATNAISNALDYFGRAVSDAATAYRVTDEAAALRFQRMQERLG